MSKTYRVLWMVLGGVVGGYLGYWLGHLAGWSTDADWPFKIGGGNGAIALSIGAAVLGVLVAGGLLALPPILTTRRLAEGGARADATIVDRWSLGPGVSGLRSGRRQYGILVEVRLPGGSLHLSHATQWLGSHEFAAMMPGRQVTVRYDPLHPDRVLVEMPQQMPIS
jgi:hypothetical protein